MTLMRKVAMKTKVQGHSFAVAVTLLATALPMLLVVSLSVPLLRASWIFRLRANVDGVARFVEFGIWGYCLNSTEENSRNTAATFPQCTRKMLGWTIGPEVVAFLQASRSVQTAPTNMETSLLVVYPASAALVLITFGLALSVYVAGKTTAKTSIGSLQHPKYLGTQFCLGCLTALTTFFVLLVHLELVTSVKKAVRAQLNSGNETLRTEWGNATWLCLAALVSLCGNIIIIRSVRTAKRKRDAQISEQTQLPMIPLADKHSMIVTDAES
ncbi:hypothetical protein P691DRAFT_156608 [Macrolepiota fuliginosa MF-IS2]|uniref:Uncharacterized protein n=1 Tax=Macrolepiota fuliginosa MF-IS2 TaxID=1400762 RepID=A0A9P5XBQ8_9AGAR|nr:hypothetical protein P691DRAFT_156608 [Macrolepiota fuliginosa MF-IS2]